LNPVALIVNPVSGNGKGYRNYLKVKSELEHYSISFAVFFTRAAGDEFMQYLSAFRQGFKLFIIIGGDGTVSKVINAFLASGESGKDEIRFGVIPSGTGNDWCRHHQIPLNPLMALQVILKGKIIHQDAGIIRSGNGLRYFFNMAGTGFQGYVVQQISKSKKPKSFRWFYYLKVLQYLFSYRSAWMKIRSSERQINEQVFSVAVAICKYNGGGMMQAPFAIADDGFLDITVIRKMNILQLLLNFPKITSGRHTNHKKVTVFKTTKISVESESELYADADGELSFKTPVEFSVLPGALKMFVP
jgi:YegS/Rv2252/BmrU family lipid kinase